MEEERQSIYQNKHFAHHGYSYLLCAEGGGVKNIVDGGHHVELCPPYVLYEIENIIPNIEASIYITMTYF